VLTLGLGIGANAAIYSRVESGLRRPLPGVAVPDRVVMLDGMVGTRDAHSISYPDFVEYRDHRPDGVADAIAYRTLSMSLRLTGDPQRVWGQIVSGNYFDALGVRAALGRTFLPEEDRTPNTHPVAVLSYAFWERHLGRDPAVLGRRVTLNGRDFTVIGVADASFRGNEPFLSMDLWVPMMMQPAVMPGNALGSRAARLFQAMVRLKAGEPLARAQAGFDVISRNLATAYPENIDRSVRLYELWRAPGRAGATVLPGLVVMMVFAGVVLMIACANVANLLLARAVGRQRETSVRLALGAGRRRLVQQLLTESAMLAAAGGVAGIAIAWGTARLATGLVPPLPIPVVTDSPLDTPVLLFTTAVTALSALVFGLAPAWQGSSSSMLASLKASAASVSSSPSRARVRRTLVVVQVAASLVLLVSASLFMRALQNAQTADPGFSTRSGLLTSIDLTPAGYDQPHGLAFYRDLIARVREIPGVEAATMATRVPLIFWSSAEIKAQVEGYTPALNEDVIIDTNHVGSDYLRTMGVALLGGREFTDRDLAGMPDVGIANETLAARYFKGASPIGRHVQIGRRSVQIVGVARDGKYAWITETPRPFLYLPFQQWYWPDAVLHVKTAGDAEAIVPAVQRVVRDLDRNVPLFEIRTIADHLKIATLLQRQIAGMLSAFGALALLLATVGLYGVVATGAAQRAPEIGVRMALGASRRDIIALIVKQGLGMTVLGVGAGLAIAVGVTRLFKSLLVGVSATDGVSFAATTAILVLVALAAAYLPARRAASIDPLEALRQE